MVDSLDLLGGKKGPFILNWTMVSTNGQPWRGRPIGPPTSLIVREEWELHHALESLDRVRSASPAIHLFEITKLSTLVWLPVTVTDFSQLLG